ncbi:MAG: protocatechuate 3,4-dioxygenase [Planctomycetota bacterium]|nr:protocatechuate 3,4-dioxygenase [Planctomycetota bacterium]
MREAPSSSTRRAFLSQVALGAAAFATPFATRGLFAEELLRTARQGEGPFYPDKLPLDTDNDLLIINEGITPAVGKVTHLSGRVLDLRGEPIRNAVVEIWQVDSQGAYLHSRSANRAKRDANFQGFGRFLTGLKGEYYFRTIKPVAYPGRTPHIHLIVKKGEKRLLTTQLYVKGEKRNETDGLFRRIRDAKARESVIIDFAPIKGSKIGELAAKADIVVGLTPEDPADDPSRRRGGRRRRRL